MRYKLLIFDNDGTLYQFPGRGKDNAIIGTGFYREVWSNAIDMLSEMLSVARSESEGILEGIYSRYGGDVSIGLERVYGIDRSEYFSRTWNIDAGGYLKPDNRLRGILSSTNAKKCVLTSAPRVWADNALRRLGIHDMFDGIWSGEGDIRKPDREAYLQAPLFFGIAPDRALIVDDEPGFLKTPKEIGMTTVLVGGDRKGFIDHNIDDIYGIVEIGGF